MLITLANLIVVLQLLLAVAGVSVLVYVLWRLMPSKSMTNKEMIQWTRDINDPSLPPIQWDEEDKDV
jgi:hypothetical protein